MTLAARQAKPVPAADFEAVVAQCSPRLLRSAYLLTGDWALAEDLLQTALARTWTHWPTIRSVDAAAGYVRTTMTRTYASWWRRRWRGEVPTGLLPDAPGDDDYAALDERDALRRALATLRPRVRAMVVLRYFDDLTEAQTAEVMGCSVGTVKSTVSRGLATLRDHGALTAEPTGEDRA